MDNPPTPESQSHSLPSAGFAKTKVKLVKEYRGMIATVAALRKFGLSEESLPAEWADNQLVFVPGDSTRRIRRLLPLKPKPE